MDINLGQPSAYDYVFPVFGGKLNNSGVFEPFEIYGTAFYIGNNFFITCAHTIINHASERGQIALGYQNEEGSLSFSPVIDSEIFEDDNDSGIMLVGNISRAKAYPWLRPKLSMLNDVISSGYAYGFDNENDEVYIRSIKGHIISVGFYRKFKGKPAHYELSYQCPRGLSGAPLIFVYQGKEPYICGMTIGGEITEMIVFSSKDVNEEDGKITTYESKEAFHRGIAVQVDSFLNLKSRLLKDITIGEYLKGSGLLD